MKPLGSGVASNSAMAASVSSAAGTAYTINDNTSFATLYCVVDTGMLKKNNRVFSLRSPITLVLTCITFRSTNTTTNTLQPTKNATLLQGDTASDSTPVANEPATSSRASRKSLTTSCRTME